MWFLTKKKHEYDMYLYGLVLAKSKSLLKYINEHPEGCSYARKCIIECKYNLSRLHPILRGFFIRALHKPVRFDLKKDSYLTSRREIGVILKIDDKEYPYGNIQYKIDDQKIFMDYSKFFLTSTDNDIIIFSSVYKALLIQQKNANAIDFNIQTREKHDLYTKHYGKEYP